MNDVTTINHNKGNDDRQQQQREKYNQTYGSNSTLENQESIPINNIISRNIPIKEESSEMGENVLK
jgi:hypothetical protein